ncbi:hypothetical protein [Clostridium pasteurianum]|uniref:hypothetical protein n=1 Tax=Clostridium pasteurianum TaxID=1501 RepID=UPI00039D65CD|nr:hypothetical protein [Clostridium pasteurianum]
MVNLDSNKCSFNNIDNYVSIDNIVHYLNNNELGSGFTIVNNACKWGTTPRKTFGYHSWKKGVPVPVLMVWL